MTQEGSTSSLRSRSHAKAARGSGRCQARGCRAEATPPARGVSGGANASCRSTLPGSGGGAADDGGGFVLPATALFTAADAVAVEECIGGRGISKFAYDTLRTAAAPPPALVAAAAAPAAASAAVMGTLAAADAPATAATGGAAGVSTTGVIR